MIVIEINQNSVPPKERIKEKTLDNVQDILNEEFGSKYDGLISVEFVGDVEIKRLNRMYRNKDKVTDVLSFSYIEEGGLKRKNIPLGDIAISLPQAKRQVQDGDLELEVIDLLVHGSLHVFGFDHELPADAQEMFSLQDKIVAQVL